MNIRRKAVFLSAVISVFLTFSAATGVLASDDASKRNASPSDPTVTVVSPVKPAANEKTSEAIKRTRSLSYGMDVIKNQRKLKKTSVREDIEFDREDFNAFAGENVSSVTIRSLPDVARGTLKLGALDVFSGQNVPAPLINELHFVPSYFGAEAKFDFSYNGKSDKNECVMRVLSAVNLPPAAEPATVYTKRGVTVYSSFDVFDPEGDEITCSVIEQPSHGVLKTGENGGFSYAPDNGYVGRDSFVCRFEDKYGNKSENVTAKVRVERIKTDTLYTDMKNNKAEYAAYLLSENDIFKGKTVADSAVFEPELTVSRADFLVCAMKAAGYSPNVYSRLRDGFGEAELTDAQRGYIVTALSTKVIDPADMSEPSSDITVGEAVKITANLTDKPAKPVSNADAPLTRADAALLLASVIDGRR